MLCLTLAGLPRILAEPDLDLLAVPCGGVGKQFLDVARVGPRAHRLQQPITTISGTAQFDADRPIGIVKLGLLGRRQIPIANDIEACRRLLDDRALSSILMDAISIMCYRSNRKDVRPWADR
jgi:hypothetical protein